MDRRIELAIAQLEADTSRTWDAHALAKLVNLSASRFRHLFKQETGISARRYLRELRFRQAESLLATTFLSIKEIAECAGLAPLNHFMREFKQRHGVTPGEYRLAARLAQKSKKKH